MTTTVLLKAYPHICSSDLKLESQEDHLYSRNLLDDISNVYTPIEVTILKRKLTGMWPGTNHFYFEILVVYLELP